MASDRDRIKVRLPDDSLMEVGADSTVGAVAAAIGPKLAAAAVAGKLNGAPVDLTARVSDGDRVEIVIADSPDGLEILRHSAAHVMAQAVGELYRDVRFGVGPTIEDGFYYDFALPTALSVDDLPAIEAKMRDIISRSAAFDRQDVPRGEALQLFEAADQPRSEEHTS